MSLPNWASPLFFGFSFRFFSLFLSTFSCSLPFSGPVFANAGLGLPELHSLHCSFFISLWLAQEFLEGGGAKAAKGAIFNKRVLLKKVFRKPQSLSRMHTSKFWRYRIVLRTCTFWDLRALFQRNILYASCSGFSHWLSELAKIGSLKRCLAGLSPPSMCLSLLCLFEFALLVAWCWWHEASSLERCFGWAFSPLPELALLTWVCFIILSLLWLTELTLFDWAWDCFVWLRLFSLLDSSRCWLELALFVWVCFAYLSWLLFAGVCFVWAGHFVVPKPLFL